MPLPNMKLMQCPIKRMCVFKSSDGFCQILLRQNSIRVKVLVALTLVLNAGFFFWLKLKFSFLAWFLLISAHLLLVHYFRFT